MTQKRIDEFRAKEMSFIFQSFFVQGNETCYENVSLPLEIAEIPARKRSAKIDQALKSVDLLDKKRSKAKDLSGGQKQRLAIARAIANDPKILFADEPTGNLDPKLSGEIMDLFERINKQGTTLFVATHDHEMVKRKDKKHIIINSGMLAEV